jgi:alcohol dehydrogenase
MSDSTVRQFWYLPMDVVHHGRGALGQLTSELARAGMQKAFVITSPSVAKRTDVVDRIREQLGDTLAGVFTGVQPHVPYGCLQPGLDQLRQAGPVLLVSVGGGSAVDAARALALAVGEGIADIQELQELRARFSPPDDPVIPPTSGRALPLVAVPLTLSAAEFANCGALTSETRRVKDLLIADELTPRAVILDPEAAVQTPVELWAATGMRALDHAIETVYSPRHGPVTDALSLAAVGQLAAALRATWHDPADIAARIGPSGRLDVLLRRDEPDAGALPRDRAPTRSAIRNTARRHVMHRPSPGHALPSPSGGRPARVGRRRPWRGYRRDA